MNPLHNSNSGSNPRTRNPAHNNNNNNHTPLLFPNRMPNTAISRVSPHNQHPQQLQSSFPQHFSSTTNSISSTTSTVKHYNSNYMSSTNTSTSTPPPGASMIESDSNTNTYTSSYTNTNTNSNSNRIGRNVIPTSQQNLSSRIQFLPKHDRLYGAVNCGPHVDYYYYSPNTHDKQQQPMLHDQHEQEQDHSTLHTNNTTTTNKEFTRGGYTTTTTNNTVSSSSSSSLVRKLGPVLLEIRYLQPYLHHHTNQKHTLTHHNNDQEEEEEEDDEDYSPENHDHSNTSPISSSSSSIYTSQTIVQSRGIPSLGTSVASTCLSFRQQQPYFSSSSSDYNNNNSSTFYEDTIHCATGLTTGAVCIHTIKNLQNYIPTTIHNNTSNGTHTLDDNMILSNDYYYNNHSPITNFKSNISSSTIISSSSTQNNIHHKTTLILDSAKSEDANVQYYSYYQPRHHRSVSSVAWRCSTSGSSSGGSSRHVAVGLVSSSSTNTTTPNSNSGNNSNTTTTAVNTIVGGGGIGDHRKTSIVNNVVSGVNSGRGGLNDVYGSSTLSSGVAAGLQRSDGGGSTTGGGGDREYCALVWDVEAQGTTSKGVKQTPSHRLSHNSPVTSLSWVLDGQLLAVGCQYRNVQIYDLRLSGTNAPPVSTYAHKDSVNGVEVDPSRPTVFATFSFGLNEPVKLWDIRRMDSCLSEIKMANISPRLSGHSDDGIMSSYPSYTSAIAWDTASVSTLAVASGDTVKFYDTVSRPVLTGITNAHGPIQHIAFRPKLPNLSLPKGGNLKNATPMTNYELITHLPDRVFTVLQSDSSVRDITMHQVSPVCISNRDGRVVNAHGKNVWIGSTHEGPSAIEHSDFSPGEDISATMMRRARCLYNTPRYSTDASMNMKMLALEQEALFKDVIEGGDVEVSHLSDDKEKDDLHDDDESLRNNLESKDDQLYRLWGWIDRIESLCSRNECDVSLDEKLVWYAKGLIDAGALKILDFDGTDEVNSSDDVCTMSPSLNCEMYDSASRRAVLTACGWRSRFGVKDVLENCESLGQFERSAALALWYGDLDDAVATLHRGADHIRYKASNRVEFNTSRLSQPHYAETLELIAMCIVGYNGSSNKKSSVNETCQRILKRPDLRRKTIHGSKDHIYLRAICIFLMNLGRENGLEAILYDEDLSLSDKIAFSCLYLSKSDLRNYMEVCVQKCLQRGDLEGIVLTGLSKRGIELLISYADRHSDVQTCALVSSRVILPQDWSIERMICSEWLEVYREILNIWQMWQSRAHFDVGRAEQLRELRDREESSTAAPTYTGGGNRPSFNLRRNRKSAQKNSDLESISSFPPQLYARCNYCNTSLALAKLRRQEGIANSWLSRQKPILSCCPNAQCQKPLPRCAICLLPLGVLNPYMELRREGNRRGSINEDDLSELANIPFAEWFTWCMNCKHGGHAHHLIGWFANHQTCPVSNCDCRCQLDGIKKLKRPAMSNKGNSVP